MTNKTVKLAIPELVYRRLEAAAQTLQLTCAGTISYALVIGSPPAWDDVPAEFQADLATLNGLADDALWPIAHSKKEPATLQRYDELLARNQDNLLTSSEKQELHQLRTEADRFMLRKAHAAALLKWRGYAPSNQLVEAANLLLADYQVDEELTSFTALDGEPFHFQNHTMRRTE